jgi:hypothetical protein
MSPFLGAAVADEIVFGRQRAELADFRPARFFTWWDRKLADSPLEDAGFELVVPL